MLVNMKDMLLDAERNKYAIASINTPNLETLQAVIWAAEEVGAGLTINHAQGSEDVVRLEHIAPYMIEFAVKAKVPVAVHLDHGYDFDFCMRAVRAGFSSIMFDNSHFPLEENIAQTKAFVKMVTPLGISVEAELGEMPNNMPTCVQGQEKSDLSDLSKYFTDPDDAVRFAGETKVDALAVSVGTVHGMYDDKPNLDMPRIKKMYEGMREAAPDTHLCLHGSSGLDVDMIREAVRNGVRKFNYFTGMDTAAAPVLLKTILDAGSHPVNYSNLVNLARDVMREHAVQAIKNMIPGK